MGRVTCPIRTCFAPASCSARSKSSSDRSAALACRIAGAPSTCSWAAAVWNASAAPPPALRTEACRCCSSAVDGSMLMIARAGPILYRYLCRRAGDCRNEARMHMHACTLPHPSCARLACSVPAVLPEGEPLQRFCEANCWRAAFPALGRGHILFAGPAAGPQRGRQSCYVLSMHVACLCTQVQVVSAACDRMCAHSREKIASWARLGANIWKWGVRGRCTRPGACASWYSWN